MSSLRIAGYRRIWERHTKLRRIAPNWLRSRVMLLPQLAAHQVALCVEGACRGLSANLGGLFMSMKDTLPPPNAPQPSLTKDHAAPGRRTA